MTVHSFLCPHCQTTLRLRDRSFVGRTIGCPECGDRVRIVANRGGELAARSAAASESPKTHAETATDTTPTGVQSALSRQLRRTLQFVRTRTTPLAVAWLTACVLLLGMLSLLFSGRENAAREIPAAENQPADFPDARANPERQPPDPQAAFANRKLLEARLSALGSQITAFVEARGRFPSGSDIEEMPAGERLGWIADLLNDEDAAARLQPQFDRSWRDPLNEPFVRRKIDAVLNPLISTTVDSNGYPATHFVGVAGVGADAPDLPIDHPRAGVFGNRRLTRPEDIRDGAANTMMVVGTATDHGAWPAGGRATFRPFVHEPYVNGPDGFGTGQHDGMYVLMADGSVRWIAKETEPTMIRRMAAMNDGLPLDPSTPGDPGDEPIAVAAVPAQPGLADAEPGLSAPLPAVDEADATRPAGDAPEVPTGAPVVMLRMPAAEAEDEASVSRRLAQPIVRFEQNRDVPLSDLIEVLEEMAGVPVRMAPELSLRSMPAVSLVVYETTVGGLLESVLAKLQLTYEIRQGAIWIIPAG